jgi:hypothetical protein
MRTDPHVSRPGERGSAMVIAVLVTVILTLLGISFLLMAETENRIAENERLGQQALYFGESAVRQVKRWFDYPNSTRNLINPPMNAIDRTQRWVDADGDPATAPVAATGVANSPLSYFKQGWDPDSDGVDDVFEKPYREGPTFALMGTEDHPDMRIDEDASTAARAFLADLSQRLLADFPTQSYRARIRSIDVYQPPHIYNGAAWIRYGIGTVKVIARIYRTLGDGSEQILAERMIKAVLNETPYYGPMGPLHSCETIAWTGDFTVNWGLSSAAGNAASALTNNQKKLPASLARELSPNPRIDHLWGYNDYKAGGTAWSSYVAAMVGRPVQDPWSRFLAKSTISSPGLPYSPAATAPAATSDEPYKFPWTVATPLGDEDFEAGVHTGGTTGALSHLQQNQATVSCIELPYDIWKAVATSGDGDVHYYTWSSGDQFKENGFGTAQTFRQLTDQQTGLFFFDTKDGVAPYNAAGGDTPPFANLTPNIILQGGNWGVRGFVYLNAEQFATQGVAGHTSWPDGTTTDFQAPGEPWLDLDNDQKHDATEPWVDLTYPTVLGDPFTVAGTGGTYDARGPVVTDEAVLWGILYNNGYYEATGNAQYYGSVVTRSGMTSGPTAGTPIIYWDESIKTNWPPNSWELPRVVITRWETDL